MTDIPLVQGQVPQPAIAAQPTALPPVQYQQPAPVQQQEPIQQPVALPVHEGAQNLPLVTAPAQTVAQVAAAMPAKGITCPNPACTHAGKPRTKATNHIVGGYTKRTKKCDGCGCKFITAEVFVELSQKN